MPVSSLPLLHQPATRLFILSISSFLSLSHASHIIEKCFTSSTSLLSHSTHFLSFLLKPLHPPISTCSSAVPLLSFISTLLIFFLLIPTHLVLNPLPTSSFSTHSFGQSVNSSAHNGMKVIRHAGVDSRMIILDDQARQQMTLHFQLSLQCNVSPITGFVRHTSVLPHSNCQCHLIRAKECTRSEELQRFIASYLT